MKYQVRVHMPEEMKDEVELLLDKTLLPLEKTPEHAYDFSCADIKIFCLEENVGTFEETMSVMFHYLALPNIENLPKKVCADLQVNTEDDRVIYNLLLTPKEECKYCLGFEDSEGNRWTTEENRKVNGDVEYGGEW